MENNFNYYKKNFKKDLPAGLVVFLVALPLCLGISLASGAPLFAGIITGIIGGVVVGMLSGSQLAVSGPAAGLTVIVLNGIETMGTYEAFLMAVVLAGALQLVLGFIKAGVIGLYFPSSVIKGMLAAIGLILILKQIPHFLGADDDFFGEMNFVQYDGRNTFTEIFYAFGQINLGSLLVGALSLLILIFWGNSKQIKKNKTLKLIPGALLVVLVSILLNNAFRLYFPALDISSTHLVNLPTISSAGDFISEFRYPDFAALANPDLYLVTFTVAIVASLETLLSVEATDKLDPHKRRTPNNRELKAQGVGNILSGAIGGIPMTAVIVRSAANVDSGGVTKTSAVFHGLLLFLSVVFLSNYLNDIPLSALAAILLMVGYKLTKPILYQTQFRLGWDQFIPFIVTVMAILFTDLLRGIIIGMIVGVYFILRANYRSAYFVHKSEGSDRDHIQLKLSEHVSFLNKASIILALEKLPENSHVIIDGENSEYIDYDVLEAIENFKTVAKEKNISLEIKGVRSVEVVDAH
jgi:MFS superfamily sulfate permease-like transporter